MVCCAGNVTVDPGSWLPHAGGTDGFQGPVVFRRVTLGYLRLLQVYPLIVQVSLLGQWSIPFLRGSGCSCGGG